MKQYKITRPSMKDTSQKGRLGACQCVFESIGEIVITQTLAVVYPGIRSSPSENHYLADSSCLDNNQLFEISVTGKCAILWFFWIGLVHLVIDVDDSTMVSVH